MTSFPPKTLHEAASHLRDGAGEGAGICGATVRNVPVPGISLRGREGNAGQNPSMGVITASHQTGSFERLFSGSPLSTQTSALVEASDAEDST